DVKNDFESLNRVYFPGCSVLNFTDADKKAIEEDIQKDFAHAYTGIMLLPVKARLGVYVAYKCYLSLFKKIKRVKSQHILNQRVRIPNYIKAFILAKAGIKSQLNIL
ncbi:MAG TPA: phytoene/squalene synthase family protein, partial [Chitinophagaceae bacterium]